jgi:hypothetical protein
MINRELSKEQITAIKKGIDLGRALQDDHPEIAMIYGYYSQSEIAKMLKVQDNYGVSESVARSGVHKAIAGHNGSLGIEAYNGLIPDELEREWFRAEHMKINGLDNHKDGVGLHGRTHEEKIEDGKKAYQAGLSKRTPEQRSKDGIKGGSTSYVRGKGIHGRTAEEMTEDGIKSAINRGYIQGTDEETEVAYQLSGIEEYMRGSKTNNALIAEVINHVYHDDKKVRTPRSIGRRLRKHRRSLETKVD